MADLMDMLLNYGQRPSGLAAGLQGATQGYLAGQELKEKKRKLRIEEQAAAEKQAEAGRKEMLDLIEAQYKQAQISKIEKELEAPEKPTYFERPEGVYAVAPGAEATVVPGVPGKVDRPLTEVKVETTVKEGIQEQYKAFNESMGLNQAASATIPTYDRLIDIYTGPNQPKTGPAAPVLRYVSGLAEQLHLPGDVQQLAERYGLLDKNLNELELANSLWNRLTIEAAKTSNLTPMSDADIQLIKEATGSELNTPESAIAIAKLGKSSAVMSDLVAAIGTEARVDPENKEAMRSYFRADQRIRSLPKVVKSTDASGQATLETFDDFYGLVQNTKFEGKYLSKYDPKDANTIITMWEEYVSSKRK